jgi:hypothetical protein
MLAGYANFLIAGGTAGQSRSFSCYDVVEIGLPGLPDSPLGHARIRLYSRLQLLDKIKKLCQNVDKCLRMVYVL